MELRMSRDINYGKTTCIEGFIIYVQVCIKLMCIATYKMLQHVYLSKLTQGKNAVIPTVIEIIGM